MRLLCPWDSPGKNTGVGKASKPKKQKEKQKAQTKITEHGEETTYEGITYGAKIYRKPFSRIFLPESLLDFALSL